MTTQTPPITQPDVPVPAGAKEIHCRRVEDGVTSRLFFGTHASFEVQLEPRVAQLGYTAHVPVQVAGKQRADGTLDRWIEIDARGLLTAQDVQKMCYNALAAADELAALAIDDAPSGTGPA